MRQPIANILALVEATLSEAGVTRAIRTRLGQVREQAEWLSDLLAHLFEQPMTADGEPHDLCRVVSEVVDAERATYAGELRLECSDVKISVRAHPIALRRAIANLLSNATRAAGPDGKVVVALHRTDDRVALAIDDTGPGFGQIRHGAGIGLRSAAHSLDSCGGRIQYCRSPMGGTRALLVLRPLEPHCEASLCASCYAMIKGSWSSRWLSPCDHAAAKS